MNLADLGSIASVISLPATVVSVVVAPIAVAAYTLDLSDRLGWIRLSVPTQLVLSWGQQADAAYMIVNSQPLLGYANKFKMLLILEVPYTDIDQMSDTYIEKSAMFTITGQVENLGTKLPTPPHLRIFPPSNIRMGEDFGVVVNFHLVVFPNNLSEDQIRSLSDVERLEGKIIATCSRDMHFTANPAEG